MKTKDQRTSEILHRALYSPYDKRKWNRYFNRVERETNALSQTKYTVRHRKWALSAFSKIGYEFDTEGI